MDLANKVIAITGAGQGLGKQMALSLAESGVHLALIDLNSDQLAETKAECESFGVTTRFYVANVTEEQEVCAAFEQIEADFKQLNGVINNAGIMRDGMFIKVKDGQVNAMSLEQFQSVMDVNVTGTFLCGREASKVMRNTVDSPRTKKVAEASARRRERLCSMSLTVTRTHPCEAG